MLGLHGQHLEDEASHLAGQVGGEVVPVPRERVVQEDTRAPDVYSRAFLLLPLVQLRDPGGDGAPGHAQLLPRCEPAGQAQVTELDAASGIQQDVVCLQGLVHHALRVAVALGAFSLQVHKSVITLALSYVLSSNSIPPSSNSD